MSKTEKYIYLLIQTGCEGIEELCYLTSDKDLILRKKEEFARAEAIRRRNMNRRFKRDWDKETPDEPYKTRPVYLKNVRDYYCVQVWNGKEFECACNQLGVPPSRQMLR